MTVYLDNFKKDFMRRYTVSFLIFFIVTVLFLFFALRNVEARIVVLCGMGYSTLNILFYFIFRKLFIKYFNQNLGSQEIIFRSIFKKTRMVINNISHELRTPLNAILGFAANLYETETDKDKKKALEAIRNNSERLFSMAQKLIDFSSIETGQYKLEKEYISNDSLLKNLENKFIREIEKKQLKINVINNISCHLLFFTDNNALFEILEMLIENAIKFTDEGSVTIESAYEDGFLKYSVCDTGRGIPADKKEQVFHLYMQGNSDLDREFEGLGLGLTIAAKLTELLGGSISLRDNSGGGSCFKIRIKCPFRESVQREDRGFNTFIPQNLTTEEKGIIRESAAELSEYIKVFDPGRIRTAAGKLGERSDRYRVLADKIIKAADTFDEAAFSRIVQEMLEGGENED